jgi:hypothetical protein
MVAIRGGAAKKLCCSIQSWYAVPEMGMRKFEVLSRGSAFITHSLKENDNAANFVRDFHIVACSHVTAPWRWQKLYPDDTWLQNINEKHAHYTIELRDEKGNALCEGHLLPEVFHHGNRDLSILQ